jgi:preprotein translocase subunit Sec61beta
MVKKIKKKQKIEKPKISWKIIVAVIGAIIIVVLLLMLMGKAGMQMSK